MISHGQIQPGFLVYDAFQVREGHKTVFAVIVSHAAFSESPKAHFTGGKMDYSVINTSASKANL